MSAGGRGSYSIRIDLDASQAISAVGQLRTQLGSLAPSFQGVTGGANQAAMSFERYNTAAQRTVGTSSSLAGGLGRVSGPLGQLNSQINTTAATLPKLSSAQQRAAQTSQQMGQGMQNTIQRATALGSRIGGIAFMFTGLTAAMGEAQGMQSLLAESQAKLTSQQEKAKNAIEKYGKGSFQATRALEQLEKAERAVAFQSRITTLSIQDQFFFIGGLASIALPSVITVIGKLVQSMKAAQAAGQGFGAALGASLSGAGTRMTGIINAMIAGLNRLVPSFAAVNTASAATAANIGRNTTVLSTYTVATGAATTATGGFRAALTGLIAHPVLLVIAALATAFVALQQNVFGVTDRFREFGIALGQALPILQPLLNLLDGIAATLGITGDAVVDASERFRTAFEGFGNLSSLWHDTLAGMQRSENDIVRFFGNVGVVISDFVVNASEQFRQFAQSMIVDWNEVIPQIQSALEGLGQWLSDFFTSLPGTLADISMKILDTLGIFKLADMIASNPVLRQMGEAIMSFVDFVQDVSQDIIKRLGLDKVGAAIQEAVQGAAKLASGTAPGLGAGAPGAAQRGIQEEPFTGQPGALEFQKEQQRIKKAYEDSILRAGEGLVPGADFRFPRLAPGITGRPKGPQTFEDLQRETGIGQNQFISRFGGGGVGLLPTRPPPTGGITPTDLPAATDAMMTWRKENESIASESKKWWAQMGAGTKPMKDLEQELRILQDDTGAYHDEAEITPEIADRVKAAQEEYNKVFKETGDVTKAQNAAQQVLNQGYATTAEEAEKVETVLSELVSSNDELQKSYLQTGEAAMSGNLALEMQRQGMLEAGQAALDYGMELEKNTAFNKVWGEIIDTNAFKQAAFLTGVQNQVAELNKQKIAVAENAGALAEYARQVESGEAGQVAFARGVQTQQKALLDSKVALAETAGQLQEYGAQLASGEQQQVAFVEGQQAVQQSFLDMIRSVSEIQGSISEYDRLLADGTAQTVAFAEGMAQGQLAAREFQVEIAAANGEYQGFREGLIATNPELQRFGDLAGFTNEQIAQMAAAIGGGREAIHALVEGLREAASGFTEFLGSVDIKELDDEFEEAVEDIRGGIEDMIDVAEQEGVKVPQALENALDFEATKQKVGQQLEELWPMITGIIEAGANTLDPNIMSSAIDIAIANVKHVLEEGDLPAATQQVVQGIITEMENLKNIKDPVELQQALQNIGTKISNLAANKDGLEETTTALTGLTEVPAGNLATLAERIAEVGDSVAQLIAQRPELEKYASSLESVALNAPGTFKAAQPGFEGTTATPGTPPPEFGTQAPTIDLSGAEQSIGRIQQMLALLGPATQQAVGQMNTAFSSIGQTWPPIVAAAVTAVTEQLNMLSTNTQLVVGQMNLAFTSLGQSWPPIVQAAITAVTEQLNILGQNTQLVVGQMNLAFTSLAQTWPPLVAAAIEAVNAQLALLSQNVQLVVGQMNLAFTSIQQTWPAIAIATVQAVTAQLLQLGQQTQLVVGQMNQAFTSIQQTWPSIMQSTVSAVTSIMQQLSASTQQVVGQMNQAFTSIQQTWPQIARSAVDAVIAEINRMVGATETAVGQMISALESVIPVAEAVADAIAGIGSAAQAAESDVNSLSNAIESIPDRTVTITVQYRTVGSPPAGTSLSFGMGTRTYDNRGGRSGGGGGFGGGGFGGGGDFTPMEGEPSLQFGAQGGLGRPPFDHKSKEFNELGILAPLLIDHPMKLTVGESGPELVSVTPVNRYRHARTGEISPFAEKRAQGGFGEFHTMGEGPTGGGFAGTINFGQGLVQFRDSGPIQVNVMQGGAGGVGGGGIGTGLPTTGGGFPTTGGFGQPTGGFQQVPGGSVFTQGNAVACVNGQCFGNMAGFGPTIGQPQFPTQQQQKPFEPVRDEQGMIKAIDTLKEWFKYLGIPLGGIGGAGLTLEDIQKNFNPFRPTFEGGMFPGFGGFGGGAMASAGRGGAAAAAGGGGAMAMAGNAVAIAGRMTFTPPSQDASNWQVVSLDHFGHTLWFVVDDEGKMVNNFPFVSEEDAQRFIMFHQMATQQPQQFGGGGGGFGGIPTMGGPGFGGGNTVIKGNPALLNTPFFNNFFGGNNPFAPGGGGSAIPTGGVGGFPTGGGGTGEGGCSICGAASDLSSSAGNLSNTANQFGNVIPELNNTVFDLAAAAEELGGRVKDWGGNLADPNAWQVVNMRDDPKLFKVIDDVGKNIADQFETQEAAMQFIMQAQQAMLGQFPGGAGPGQFQGQLPAGMTPEQFVQQFMTGQFGGQGGVPGQINMTGGNINFDANQGEVEMRTSTGAIAIAGPGGAFATAGRATAGVGLFGPTPEEEQQLRQLQALNQNLENIGGQIGQQGEMIEFQQQQNQQMLQQGPFGGVPGLGPTGGQPVMFQQPQQFTAPGFTGFGQTFQPFPGGGAVGSGTNDPLGFLNQQLGGFGIPTPAGIPGGGGVPGGVTAPGGVGGGAGGVGCDVCGAIRSLGGATVGGGVGGGGTGGGGVPSTGGGFGGGGAGEPSFIGGGGGVGAPTGGGGGPGTTPPAPGQTTPGCRFGCVPMDSDPDRYKIIDVNTGDESGGGVYYDELVDCNQRLQELCPTSLSPGNNMTPAPTQNQPPYFQPGTPAQPPVGGGFGQPGGTMQTGGGRAVAIAGGGMLGGTPVPGQQPGFGMPIGPPPVPPRIVQEAGLPSQHIDVNQDPTTWQIVESAGLVGTYDIIDDNGDVVQLGFRTLRDAEIYLNYFISYYEWVKSGSTGIPGPVPVGGGAGFGGGGIGGGIPVGGAPGGGLFAGTGGGITATAGNAQASAGGGGAFAQAGGAMASAGGFLGGGTQGPKIPTGPTQEPVAPFEPIPRPQGPFRHGQDNQEPIYDNSGIKIGADFGTPGEDTVTMEDVEEGGGGEDGGGGGRRGRFRERLRRHLAAAFAGRQGDQELHDRIVSAIETAFGNIMLSMTVNSMLDGSVINANQEKFRLKKVSVFT